MFIRNVRLKVEKLDGEILILLFDGRKRVRVELWFLKKIVGVGG